MEPDPLRALGECARVHKLSKQTLNKMLATGEVAYVRLPGGERRIPDSAMRSWISKNLVSREGDAA